MQKSTSLNSFTVSLLAFWSHSKIHISCQWGDLASKICNHCWLGDLAAAPVTKLPLLTFFHSVSWCWVSQTLLFLHTTMQSKWHASNDKSETQWRKHQHKFKFEKHFFLCCGDKRWFSNCWNRTFKSKMKIFSCHFPHTCSQVVLIFVQNTRNSTIQMQICLFSQQCAIGKGSPEHLSALCYCLCELFWHNGQWIGNISNKQSTNKKCNEGIGLWFFLDCWPPPHALPVGQIWFLSRSNSWTDGTFVCES